MISRTPNAAFGTPGKAYRTPEIGRDRLWLSAGGSGNVGIRREGSGRRPRTASAERRRHGDAAGLYRALPFLQAMGESGRAGPTRTTVRERRTQAAGYACRSVRLPSSGAGIPFQVRRRGLLKMLQLWSDVFDVAAMLPECSGAGFAADYTLGAAVRARIGAIMAYDYLPTRESALLTWALNFSTKITATPIPFGLTAAQATGFAALYTAYNTAYQTASNRTTRSPVNVELKNVAKQNMLVGARSLANVVQNCPTVTNAQRLDLGLTVRVKPAPVPPPATAPKLEIGNVTGWTVRITLRDAASGSKRGRPAGVSGASVFSYVGATPPTEGSKWAFEGNTGRTTLDVVFPSTVPAGATVWISAFWFNGRKESGPACAPIQTNLQGGMVSMAA